MDNAKNVRWLIPFKKFGMVRVEKRARRMVYYYNVNYALLTLCEIF